MAMENPPLEYAFPIGKGEFQLPCQFFFSHFLASSFLDPNLLGSIDKFIYIYICLNERGIPIGLLKKYESNHSLTRDD